MLKCGLVILNYIDYSTTISLINIIKDFTELEHIVIVDNASPNDSYQRLKAYENSKISVIQSGRNGGYAFGNNVGVRFLKENFKTDIIGIANPDVVFDNDLVRTVKQAFIDNPNYAVITGLQLDSKGKIADWAFHGKYTVSTIFRNEAKMLVSLFTRIFRKIFRVRANDGQKNYIYDTEKLLHTENLLQGWEVSGSLFFARAADFEQEGLFDEGTFMYWEEAILASRVERMGKKSGFIPAVKFRHLEFHHFSNRPMNIWPRIKAAYHLRHSQIYYFNNYVTDNKFLQVVHECLAWMNIFNECAQIIIFTTWKRLKQISSKPDEMKS